MIGDLFGELLKSPEAGLARVRLAQMVRDMGQRPAWAENLARCIEKNGELLPLFEELDGAEEFGRCVLALMDRPETMRVVMKAARKAALGGV